MDFKIGAIIRCYNEKLMEGKVISDFKKVVPDAGIYVVDNNSTDGTAEIATAFRSKCNKRKAAGKRLCRPVDVQ